MIDLEFVLLTTNIKKDNIGNDIEEIIETKVPIIKIENIYASEFYNAGSVGMKPTLKIRISSLNFNNQKKVKYMDEIYEIIRVDRATLDEISLICERKVRNDNQ